VTRGRVLQNAVRAMRIVYVERSFRYWTGWWLRSVANRGFDTEMLEQAAKRHNEPDVDTPRANVNTAMSTSPGAALGSPQLAPSKMGTKEDMDAYTSPGAKGEFERVYKRSMRAIADADENRMRRRAHGKMDDSDSEEHDWSDEELEAVIAAEDAGPVGSLIGYLASLKTKEKNGIWMKMFERMFNAWHVNEIARLAWSFGLWRQMKLRTSNHARGQELTKLKEELQDTTQALTDCTKKFDHFRLGRVGTYIVNNKADMEEDKETEDDYSQLVAYTRRMNSNWTKERLMRGISASGWVLGRAFWSHLASRFYTWRMQTLRLKLLAQKFSLFELDKLELQAEASQAAAILDDQEGANRDLEDTVARLKAEVAKLRREKAWVERYAGKS